MFAFRFQNWRLRIFHCSSGGLSAAIEAGEAKGPAVSSDIEEAEGEKTQLEEDLKAHSADRVAAKASIAEASAIREKATPFRMSEYSFK